MNGFDRLARPYRWMEYLSFGRALERCRFHFLPQLHTTQRALLLGDGDGRFTAALLQQAPQTQAIAIDGSEGMLRALRQRCEAVHAGKRLTTICTLLNEGLPAAVQTEQFDLIATHFFLDCLSGSEVEHIVHDAMVSTTDNARWVISEFNLPRRGAMWLPSRIVVRLLYLAFRILTGLCTQHLPPYANILRLYGWHLSEQQTRLGGLLVSQLWQREKA
ncbi:MAG TPA: class I SAM-dependent methyltransferase [Terriglobus sp.]